MSSIYNCKYKLLTMNETVLVAHYKKRPGESASVLVSEVGKKGRVCQVGSQRLRITYGFYDGLIVPLPLGVRIVDSTNPDGHVFGRGIPGRDPFTVLPDGNSVAVRATRGKIIHTLSRLSDNPEAQILQLHQVKALVRCL